MKPHKYAVSLGFDWNTEVNPTIKARPLEIYLVASNGHSRNDRLATFQDLNIGLPFFFRFHDITAAAEQRPRADAFDATVAPYRPQSAVINFARYDAGVKQRAASPLDVTGVVVDQDPTADEGTEPFETHFAGVWVANSVPFPRFPVYTWKLRPEPSRIENPGRFDMVVEMTVEEVASGEMRKFYVDPELVVGTSSGGGP